MWRNYNPHTLLVGMQNGQLFWKMIWQFLRMLNMEFPYNLAILLLDIYPRELETYVHKITCIQRLLFLFSHPVMSDSLRPHGLCSTPVLSVHHHFLKFAQAHVHCIGDAIQPSHPLMTSSPSALNLSQHQGLSQWLIYSQQMTKIMEPHLQQQFFQWLFWVDLP